MCRYVRAFEHAPVFGVSLDKVRFVVFDTETTGFDPVHDSVISIGAVALRGGSIDVHDSFEVLVCRETAGDRDAVTVHGLLRRDLVAGISEDEAASRFVEYAGNSVLVAQHADFDIAMMNRVLKRHYGLQLFNDVLDTASLAKRLEKGPYYNLAHKSGEYRLDSLLERYDIRLFDRHTAAGDAFLTAQLFQRLLQSAGESGIRTLGDLLLK
ncbi:3'-5' exonuclease [Prosthecochloris sp. N3]|uniref:3'-5' exonuclease n=2 Tax=Chlorobiaceae TaxID=191412 RepID=A0ABR9XPV6_9CHLB|nr:MULTISPECIES: 3'-5' exonuclease [Prosthecochloris]MBF0586211.1 3'-5' exonuclease [Prosthecochloris ethylica]MBF0635917.1 3'-5' exonuclease [Prosthecochloris ethylica]NUK47408.1 3'-5' exonuclease [Prosthecochloris ethylica]RNA64958.1 3'-5' exonuclease [Prosthecochloris sp. ZM_2]